MFFYNNVHKDDGISWYNLFVFTAEIRINIISIFYLITRISNKNNDSLVIDKNNGK